MSNGNQKRLRGFAKMKAENPDRLSEVCASGGKTAHLKGTAHQFTSEEAREAGKIGGAKVAVDRAHMARIGSVGGKRSFGGGRKPKTPETSMANDIADMIERGGEATPYGN